MYIYPPSQGVKSVDGLVSLLHLSSTSFTYELCQRDESAGPGHVIYHVYGCGQTASLIFTGRLRGIKTTIHHPEEHGLDLATSRPRAASHAMLLCPMYMYINNHDGFSLFDVGPAAYVH